MRIFVEAIGPYEITECDQELDTLRVGVRVTDFAALLDDLTEQEIDQLVQAVRTNGVILDSLQECALSKTSETP